MNNKIYSMGVSLGEAIELREIRKTKLGVVFEKKLRTNCDIDAVMCELICFGSNSLNLVIYVENSSFSLLNEHCKKIQTSFYPDDFLRKKIIDSLEQAIEEQQIERLPDAKNLPITVFDFYRSARTRFFNKNIVAIDKRLRKEYSNLKFSIRFSMDAGYYVIFPSEGEMEKAKENGQDRLIIKEVNSFCRENDHLSLFKDFYAEPIITDINTIKKEGSSMGILRENPDFDSL